MKKILLIDDNKDFRSEICQFLIENDFNLMEVVNGLQFSKKQYPVLILCDIELYNLDQDSLLKEFQKTFINAQFSFIFLTVKEELKRDDNYLHSDVSYYLTKPVKLSKLLEIICKEAKMSNSF